jgi:predicted nuclease of restriction endonuclease-like (RecB) superfamily
MAKLSRTNKPAFENVLRLIQEARIRAFSKVNAELVMLYFNVGQIVSVKVAEGEWGDATVDELVLFIEKKIPGLTAFNRRGLYRMKQFYETYAAGSECSLLWEGLQGKSVADGDTNRKGKSSKGIVSPTATQLKRGAKPTKNAGKTKVSPTATQIGKPSRSVKGSIEIVSPTATQFRDIENMKDGFVGGLLTQISWTNHLEILSATKSAEEKLFYIFTAIREKWSKAELRRQLSSAYFERTMLGNKRVAALPSKGSNPLMNIFKDPYIFDFLELPERHSESDLEQALAKNLQKFILEIGKGFTYMGSRFRLQVGKKDYHTDFYSFIATFNAWCCSS